MYLFFAVSGVLNAVECSKSSNMSAGRLAPIALTNSRKNLVYMASLLFGRSANTQGNIFLLCSAWILYIWKKTSGHSLKGRSANQWSELAKSSICRSKEKIITLSRSPRPLSKNKKLSPFLFSWYCCGITDIVAKSIGLDGTFCSARTLRIFLFNESKFTTVVSVNAFKFCS